MGNTNKVITRISVSKNKITLYFNKEKVELSHDTFTNHYLFKGKELSVKEINDLKKEDESSKALSYAKNLFNSGMYTEWTVREKLYKKEFEKPLIDKVIDTLKKDGLINDVEYAKEYILYANEKLVGKNKIIQELKNKGVFQENLTQITFKDSDEIKKAKELIPKLDYKYQRLSYNDKKKHIYDAYIRNGYDSDIALRMLEYVKSGSKKEEEDKLKKDFEKAYRLVATKDKDLRYKKDYIVRSLSAKGYKYKDIMKLWEEKQDEITY